MFQHHACRFATFILPAALCSCVLALCQYSASLLLISFPLYAACRSWDYAHGSSLHVGTGAMDGDHRTLSNTCRASRGACCGSCQLVCPAPLLSAEQRLPPCPTACAFGHFLAPFAVVGWDLSAVTPRHAHMLPHPRSTAGFMRPGSTRRD